MRIPFTVLLLSLSAAGCTVDAVDFTGKHCPCAEGYECVRGSCRPPGWDAGAPPRDAGTPGRDASGPADASMDAAAPVDAGADAGPDASALDAGTDAGPPGSCATLTSAVFCDDFEDGDLDPWSPEVFGGGAIENVTSRAHGGARSMRVSTTAASARAYAHAMLGSSLEGEAHFRAWYFIPAETAALLDAFYLQDASAFGVGVYLMSYRRGTGTWYGTTTGTWREGVSSVYPLGEWFCLQARIVRGVGDGRIEITTDGATALLQADITLDVDPFQAFLLGVDGEAQPSIEYFVDDVAWSTNAIPCGP